jgi:hypothetical protein
MKILLIMSKKKGNFVKKREFCRTPAFGNPNFHVILL